MLPHFHTFSLADLQVENDLALDHLIFYKKILYEDKSKETESKGVYLHLHGKHYKVPIRV